jgi:uncharacterized protein (DUF3820 family)
MDDAIPDKQEMLDLLIVKMPFGKYKGRLMIDLPEYYLNWFYQKGFPEGKIGKLLAQTYEIKLNGLEGMVRKIQRL